jgi:nucleotide-binding universal stress UspA family protein
MTATTHPAATTTTPTQQSIFARILVGIDGTSHGFDACRQAARLADPEGTIEAASVAQFPPTAAAALGVERLAEELERNTAAALSEAGKILGPHAQVRALYGLTVPELLEEAKRIDATLLAIGIHGRPRMQEIIFGGVAGELLHQAPCSVLLARPIPDVASFPSSIVVGIDGSDEAERAHDVALELATRFKARHRGIVAMGGKRLNVHNVLRCHRRARAHPTEPVAALVEASESADLLVVGSRGLHGLRAIGSVSERVAHEAGCSVLVVR